MTPVTLRFLLVTLAWSGCAVPVAQIVAPRDLPQASGQPHVRSVTDLGGRDIPLDGVLSGVAGGVPASDGQAVIGEALWIEGDGFGRQPTVLIGGRPAPVLARTSQGGILTRVPIGTVAGSQRVRVAQEFGIADAPITIRRYGLLSAPGLTGVGVVEVGEAGVAGVGMVPVDGARGLCFSADGRAGYVVTPRALFVLELPAPRKPAHAITLPLPPGEGQMVLCAGRTLLVLQVRPESPALLRFDTTRPLRPAAVSEVEIPPALIPALRAHPEGLRLSPDGSRLALTVGEGNRVATWSLESGPVIEVPVLADVPLSVLVDAAFSPSGDTLWVLTGGTAANQALGVQPTELRAFRLTEGRLKLARTVTLGQTGAPTTLVTGRTVPLASGAAIRLPPERATVYVGAAGRPGSGGMVLAVDAADTGLVLATGEGPAGVPDVTPDGRWVMVPFGTHELEVLSAPADGRPGPTRTVSLPGLGTPTGVPSVRLQP